MLLLKVLRTVRAATSGSEGLPFNLYITASDVLPQGASLAIFGGSHLGCDATSRRR